MNIEQRNKIAKIVEVYKEHMTMKDMSDEFDIPYHCIRDYCIIKGIKMSTAVEINIRYIREMAGRKTREQIAKAMDVEASYVRDLAKKEGITLLRNNKYAV